MVRSNASSGAGPSRPTVRFAVTMPAQFTATRGARADAAATASRTCDFVGDIRRHEPARSPSSAAASSPRGPGRSTSTTCAPPSTSDCAVARPSRTRRR